MLRRFRTFVSAACASVLLLAWGLSPAIAHAQPVVTDRIELVGLTSKQPHPDSPPSDVQFEAVVNYKLDSSQDGFLLLFLFENSQEDSTQDVSDAIPVKKGTGQVILDIDYTVRTDVRTLTLVAGLFRPPQRLVAWVST